MSPAAAAEFFSKALHNTKDANGILLYVSVFERRVWVLGDHGIDEKIDPQTWQEIVDLVSQGIKQGSPCRALCDGIERIGTILKDYFPIEADDKDELDNLEGTQYPRCPYRLIIVGLEIEAAGTPWVLCPLTVNLGNQTSFRAGGQSVQADPHASGKDRDHHRESPGTVADGPDE